MNFLKQLFTKTPKSKPYNRVDHGGNKYLIPDVLLESFDDLLLEIQNAKVGSLLLDDLEYELIDMYDDYLTGEIDEVWAQLVS